MIRNEKTFEAVKTQILKKDITILRKKKALHMLGFERDCPSWRQTLVEHCSQRNLIPLFTARSIAILEKPVGERGIAFELLMETYL